MLGIKVACPVQCSQHYDTHRYSIRSSPIRPNFQMTTFKAKNVFLVLGMGHNMNKLTYVLIQKNAEFEGFGGFAM